MSVILPGDLRSKAGLVSHHSSIAIDTSAQFTEVFCFPAPDRRARKRPRAASAETIRPTQRIAVPLTMTSSALPFNEFRSYAGHPTHRRTSPVALSPELRHRPGMLDCALAVARTLLAIFASRADLVLENLALRRQLAVLRRKHPRPRLSASDRVFWLALRRGWPRWEEPLAIIRPETVDRWRREGFRRYWRWRSRRVPLWKADRRHLCQPVGMTVADTRRGALVRRVCRPFQAA